MSQGIPFFSNKAVKEAAKKGAGIGLLDFGKRAYDAGADLTKNVLNTLDKAQIENSKKGLNNPVVKALGVDKAIKQDIQKRQQAIKQRELEDKQRNRDVKEIGLEDKGLATRLESKDRIVKKLATNEVKRVKQLPNQLQQQGNQALGAFEKQLKDNGYSDREVSEYVNQARQSVEAKNAELAQNETKLGQAEINKLASSGGVNPFAIDRASQEFDRLQGKEVDTKRAIRTSAPVETIARTMKAASDFGNDAEILGATALDQTLGRGMNAIQGKGFIPTNLTQVALADVERAKQQGAQVGGMNYADALDQDQSLGAQAQRFVGQSVPFLLAPETALARRGSVAAAKMLRPGLLRNVVQAGIKEGLQDTPLSLLQTAGELNRQVQTGEITTQEAMQQAPGAILGNAAGDFLGAGALRGAGDLAGKALKGIPDIQSPTRSQKGSMILEAPKTPETPKPLTPDDLKKAQYQKSVSRLNEIAPRQKEITQQIAKAQNEGDFVQVAQLKQEAQAIKQESKYLKQTVNNLELEGLQRAKEQPQAQAATKAVKVNSDVENIKRILGEESPEASKGQIPEAQIRAERPLSDTAISENLNNQTSLRQDDPILQPINASKQQPQTNQPENILNQTSSNEIGNPENLAQKAQSTEPSKSLAQSPRNQVELENTYKQVFKLDEPKAKAAAVVTDRIFDTIARRKGITKEAAYGEVLFKKSSLGEVGKGAKFQAEKILPDWAKEINFKDSKVQSFINTSSVDELLHKYVEKPHLNYLPAEVNNLIRNRIKEAGLAALTGWEPNANELFAKRNNIRVDTLKEAFQEIGDLNKQATKQKKAELAKQKNEDKQFAQARKQELNKLQKEQIESKEFKKWFGKSKVTDSNNKPLVVYHGTGKDFNEFDPSKAGDNYEFIKDLDNENKGLFFTSSQEEASFVAGENAGKQKDWDGNVKPVYLNIKNPFVLKAKDSAVNHFDSNYEQFIDEAILKGHDGIIVRGGGGNLGKDVYVAFEPTQIKSAIGNSGKFDPSNPDIRFQSEKGAMETLESGKKVVHALTDPNVSTPLHEVAHVYEEVLTKTERNTILDWAGSKTWDTNASEKFARGFERYLTEGKAPIPELKRIFDDFKDWLVDIYKGIAGSEIDLKLNKEMRRIYDVMIASDPKVAEALTPTKIKGDNLKQIRRTIKDPKEFQEAVRNPKNLNTLSEAYGDGRLPKNSEKVVSEASKVKKELNDLEASLKDNKAQLASIMKKANLDSIDVEVDGKKYTIKRPNKADDKVVFNNDGRLAREELVKQFQEEGKISFDADQGINLAIQTQSTGQSRASKFGPKNVEEAAKEHIKFLREAALLGEKEAVLKEKIMKEIAPNLENGGLDHVWRNNEGDTSFAIKRNPAKSNFKTPEAEAEFKAREAQLKTNTDLVKIQKGKYGSTGVSEAQALGINRRSKAGKAEYEEFQSKVRRDIEAKTALEDGIETPKQAESVIESGLEQYKKLDDNKGKQFAFNPAMGAALLDSDAALLGVKVFKPLIDKAINKQGKLVNEVYDTLKTVVGRSESYATRLRDSKIPAFRKLIEDYDNLAAREYQAEGYMRTKFSPEQVEKIGAAIKEHGFKELEDMIKSGKAIEGIESADEMEILKAFMQNRRKRADLIKNSIEEGRKANVNKGDLALLESFYANETKVNKGTGAALSSLASDLLYFKALWNNLRSTTLAATDPLTKLVPEYGLGKTALSLKDVIDPKVRKSNLFKAYNAGASGTFVDALTARKAEGIGKIWEKVKKASIFSAVTEASQDMGLLAHARSFNDYWKKKTGQSINILDDFDGLNEVSQEFALMHNAITNKLYGAGKGTIYQAEIEGNNFIKPFMAFMGEPIRFQKRMTEWRSIMAKANEPGATALDKEMAKRARNSMITFVGMTALLGGSTALKNMGGAIGSSYNLALNMMTPEQRQKTEDFVNAAQLTRYLNVDLGEKLGVSLFQRGEKETFLDNIKKTLSGDTGLAVVDAIKQYPKDFDKMISYFKAGNKEQGMFTMAKMLMGSAPGTVDKVLKKLNQEPVSVWIEENGNMKEEFKKVDLADILSYSANETDIKKAVKMESKAKEAVLGQVEKIGKRYKLKGKNQEFSEYIDLLASKRFKLNPEISKEELTQELLKSAFTKQKNQVDKLGKFAPKTSAAYLRSQSEDDLVKRVALTGGAKKREAIRSLQTAKQEASKRGRKKFVDVLMATEEAA